MFMFRRRRNALVKRLWKARVPKHETDGQTEDVKTGLFKKLKDSQLEMLLAAVESRGGTSECVLLEGGDPNPAPNLVSCQTWRWPDLDQPRELKQLPACRSDNVSTCCNPYHWSRLCLPDTPPPPYCRFASERLKPEDRAPSESSQQLELRGSLSTNGEGEGSENQWCKLAYWEMSQRIGRQFAVETTSINVFWSLPHGDGLCLATLASHSFSPTEPVRRAREKIGRGVTLCRESDGVWAYNRSDSPMFINSPALDDPDSRSLMVYRVPPGYCLNIFRVGGGGGRRRWVASRPNQGPVDPNSVRISFAKGWGPKYSRQEITACPTWLEVLLAPCR